MLDEILSYREMCDNENKQTLQRGMNFRICPNYSIVLMSRRTNAPYSDKILDDGITIEYQGHDESKTSDQINPKIIDQPEYTKNSKLTQNGLFINAINSYKSGKSKPELIKVYEKIFPGVWSLKGFFELIDCHKTFDGVRNIFVFILKLSNHPLNDISDYDLEHTRLIPSEVKKEVWQRDKGKCVLCGVDKNLHFDHDLPFSKGGTGLTARNIRILCVKCNLRKSANIE